MNTIDIGRHWPRPERAGIDPRWVVILGAMIALFAGSFAVGHATKGASSASHAEASASISVTPAVASVPKQLSTAPALGVGPVAHPVHHKKAQPAAQAVSAPAQPLSREAPRPQAPIAQPVQSAPAPAPRPAPAPVVRPPAAKPAPVRSPAPTRHSTPSSGGGSFESSG